MLSLTDLCDYCEKGHYIKKMIDKYSKDENLDNPTIEQMKKHFTDKSRILQMQFDELIESSIEGHELQKEALGFTIEKLKTVVTDLKDYDVIEYHKLIAKTQRLAYNEHRTSTFLKNKIMIELDYKQKIVIGMSPRQINKEYYNTISRSCLGKSHSKSN
jgi:hypothetical protein